MTIDNVPADVVFGTLLPCGKTWDVAEDEDLNGIDAGATMASAYETGAPENCGSFSDPMLDKLFTEQNAMLTQAQRQVVLRWAEAVIARQRPARFLCGPDMIAATQGISGYDPNPFTVDSWNSWAWSAKG